MLKLVALILLTLISRGNCVFQWGSRIVATPSGPSPTLDFLLPGLTDSKVNVGDVSIGIKIENNVCMVNGTRWGAPCTIKSDLGTANLTVDDVTKQSALVILAKDAQQEEVVPLGAAFFVPRCQFKPPGPDEMDMRLPFPYSRFEQGNDFVLVTFAVGGANLNTMTLLLADNNEACEWTGTTPTTGHCPALVKDEKEDIRIYYGNFSRNGRHASSFALFTQKDFVMVNVDWEQKGKSPDYEECAKFPTTATTSTTPKTPTMTTSSASRMAALLPSVLVAIALLL